MSRYPGNGSAAVFDDMFCCCQKKMSTTKYVIIKPTAKARCDIRDVLACPQAKKAINPFDGRPMPCMFDPTCPAALPDAQFERGSIGEYKPRSGCSPLHGGCAWMRTGHSTQRARAAKHLGGK